MDIPRPSVARQKRIRRTIIAVVGLVVLVLVTVGLAQLKPAAPTVEFGSVWPDTVKRGSMLRQVRGPGTLVPEDIRWIPAVTEGRVERILTLPGTVVEPSTVILELSDQRVQQEALDAEFQLRAAEADLTSVRVRLQNELLQQQSAAADIQAQFHRARITAEANEQLSKEGLQSNVTTQISRVEADELANRNRIEQERLKIRGDSAEAQLAAEQARVAQRRALYELRRSQIEALKVRAGIAGVLRIVTGRGGAARECRGEPRPGGRAGPAQGPAPHSRHAGQGPRIRPQVDHRHAERRSGRACRARRSRLAERNRARRRHLHRTASEGGAARPERGRHD